MYFKVFPNVFLLVKAILVEGEGEWQRLLVLSKANQPGDEATQMLRWFNGGSKLMGIWDTQNVF